MNNVITDENHRSPEFTDHPQVKGKTVFFGSTADPDPASRLRMWIPSTETTTTGTITIDLDIIAKTK